MSARQLKIGLRVSDLERSATLYRQLGFRTIPDDAARAEEALARSGPLGAGFVLVVPTGDLDAVRELWRREGLR